MSNKPVALNLTTGITLPQIIVLPMILHSKLGIDRRLTIHKRDQKVPEAVREWLRADKRYTAWFAPDQPQPAAETWNSLMTTKELIAFANRYQVIVGKVNRKADVVDILREAMPEAERES